MGVPLCQTVYLVLTRNLRHVIGVDLAKLPGSMTATMDVPFCGDRVASAWPRWPSANCDLFDVCEANSCADGPVLCRIMEGEHTVRKNPQLKEGTESC